VTRSFSWPTRSRPIFFRINRSGAYLRPLVKSRNRRQRKFGRLLFQRCSGHATNFSLTNFILITGFCREQVDLII